MSTCSLNDPIVGILFEDRCSLASFQPLVNFASKRIDEIFNGCLGSSLLTAGTAENVWICPAYPRPALPSTGACRATSTSKQSLWVIGKKRHGYEHWQENKTQFIHDVCWIVLSQLVCRSEISLPLYTFYANFIRFAQWVSPTAF